MPVYNIGEHKVDHPPVFACREHKALVRFTESFITDILSLAQDVVPGNLAEYAAPLLGGNEDALKLPDYLIPPRVVIFNPDGLRGPDALPFTLVFIDKRFIGIPARYLTRERFEGCPECEGVAPEPAKPPQRAAAPAGQKPPSGIRPALGAAKPPSGPTAKPGSGVHEKNPLLDSRIQRRAPIPGIEKVPSPHKSPRTPPPRE